MPPAARFPPSRKPPKAPITCFIRCGTRCGPTPLSVRSATPCETYGASTSPEPCDNLAIGAWRSAVAIEWNPSRGATLGVEWEVQLIDAETKLLRQEAGKLDRKSTRLNSSHRCIS